MSYWCTKLASRDFRLIFGRKTRTPSPLIALKTLRIKVLFSGLKLAASKKNRILPVRNGTSDGICPKWQSHVFPYLFLWGLPKLPKSSATLSLMVVVVDWSTNLKFTLKRHLSVCPLIFAAKIRPALSFMSESQYEAKGLWSIVSIEKLPSVFPRVGFVEFQVCIMNFTT